MHFKLADHRDVTLISETIYFRSVLPKKWMMKRIFRAQHTQLFKNMGQLN